MFQLFTTDNKNGDDYPFPIDHFYYADSTTHQELVYLETHSHAFGTEVVICRDSGPLEKFDNLPSALRKMADIIEAHHRQGK